MSPLINATHAFHQQALRRELHDIGFVAGTELHGKCADVPNEHSIESTLAGEPTAAGVDDLALFEAHLPPLAAGLDVQAARLPADLYGLDEVNEPHVIEQA